ncbi:hypothetical protein TSUD_412320, partial [Trifolium subterraneum]
MEKCWFFGVLIVVGYGCFLRDIVGVEGYPNEDLIMKLPGQPKVEFKQYAGYVDIDVKHGKSLFYYFVEADQYPDKKPLTLWLNGGPGCSSIGGGAFTELGPFYTTGDGRGLQRNSNSWNKVSNLLFLESPIGVGWSYSNITSDYNNYDDAATDEVGLAIMNYCNYDGTSDNLTKSCKDARIDAQDIVGDYIDSYDVILDVCYPSIAEQELRLKKTATKISLNVDVCVDSEIYIYLNLPEVQKALHANRTNLPYPWSMCSNVLNYNNTDHDINMLPVLKRIVQNHIPVWVYSGDQDSVVPLLGSRTLIRELAYDMKFNITDPYRVWFHKGQVGGWVTEYGNLLTFATVRGAGHMVSYGQPSRGLQLFSSF